MSSEATGSVVKADVIKTLTADDILAAQDRTVEPVDVPEWGGRVYVREMTASERDRFDESMRDSDGESEKLNLVNYRARLVAASCCDSSGKLLFLPTQVKALGEKTATPVIRVFRAAQKLNKMGPSAVADEKKDSAEAPSNGSPTG